MASSSYSTKVLFIYLLLLFVFSSLFLSVLPQPLNNHLALTNRRILQDQENLNIKKKPISTKNQTKPIKPITSSTKNNTKIVKLANDSAKNNTKLIKPFTESTRNSTPTSTSKPSTSTKPTSKPSNSTKPISNLGKKPSDLIKSIKTQETSKNQIKKQIPKTQKSISNDLDQEEDDLVSGFRDLPSKFQESLLPDIEKISRTSQVYINRANKEITKGFKPIVGTKYASTVASIVSFAFILIPLILVSLIFNKIKTYFSLQKLLIFIQIYLAIYFGILCLSSLFTGLEPLRFFYATSQSTYVCLQVLQTLGYVLYLVLLLMYLVLVFSTDCGIGSRLLGLSQTFVGFSVGLHCYVTVFHRAVLRLPPLSSWRTHGIYATCFFVICLLATAERRKKAYMEEGGEEGKKN
jgi:hypothetical protein